ADNPLLSAPNISITPHNAWATREARQRLLAIALANLKAFLAGQAANRVA
ncbi:MAG: D-2-hydroxyacid dehydrogenase, partial [Shewanella sp.]